MLHLVLGIAGTGKSTRLMEEMKKRADGQQCSILLVPEQFSSSAESMVYRHLGEAGSAMVEVLSFRTLGERILKSCGGWGAPVLTDAGRVVYVRRALDAVGGHLKNYARQRRSTAFCGLCAQTLTELKTAGATPDTLRRVAGQEDEDKFSELALIFEAYEAQIDGSAMDPQDQLVLAAQQAGCGYFAGKACFIDGFDGFTAPEYKMLEQVLERCGEVWLGLCCDGNFEPGEVPGLFDPVRKVLGKLKSMAQKAGQRVAVPEVCRRDLRAQNADVAAVNTLLALGEEPEAPGSGGVLLGAASDEWEEVRLVAAEMHRLALAGVPYSKMALVCRDPAAYEQVVERQLELFEIPCFVDVTRTIEYTAPVVFLRAALSLLHGGLSSQAILALLKTGLCGYTESEIYILENYVYTWEPKAAQWRQPFENHPGGYLQEMDTEAKAQLAVAEGLRAAVVPVLDAFRQRARGKNARALSKSLYLLMDKFGAADHAEAASLALEERGEVGYAEQARRAWDLAMDLLDQMAGLLGNEEVSAREYDELFLLLVRATDFGLAPQTLESVTFSGADRMRLSEPDYCFVVGACEGEFPMQVGYSGLLSHNDRDALVRGGIEMPGSFENRTMLEDMFFYRALTAPRKGLYLSWPKRRAGQPRSMSSALEPVRRALAPRPLALDAAALAATPRAAYDLLGLEYRGNTAFAASLYEALAKGGHGEEDMDAALSLLKDVDNPGEFFVHDRDLMQALVGDVMTLSPTKAEQYYKCKFAYFMERILRAEPRRKAQVSPLESGTFVHYILEKVLAEAGEDFARCGDEELTAMALRHAEEFAAEFFPGDTRRTRWMLRQISDTTARLVLFMRDAAAQSEFSIDALELEIGTREDGIPPLTVDTPGGHTVRVIGKVDRVDALRANGHTYLCIIDYKTGNKAFKLDELSYGNNIQMMVYMQALCENGTESYPDAVPAGVLYLSSDPSPQMGGRAGGQSAFKLNGLLLSDTSILNAMDNREHGSFLPVRFGKDGTPYKSSPVLDEGAFEETLKTVRGLLGDMADGVYSGQFPARPLVKGNSRPCAWCAYRAACRHEDGQNEVQMAKREEDEG